MTISLSPARPFAALTALAVIAAGLALAPVASAGAVSASSQASSVVSKINSYRSSAKLSKIKTQNDVTEFANGIADVMADQNQPDFNKLSFGDFQFVVAEPENYEFVGFRVTGGSSSVATNVTKKLKTRSSKTDKTAIYGSFNYVGVGLQKKGKYTYVMAFFAKYTEAKLQDSKEPRITGTVAVGKTLKVDMNGWVVSGGERSYSWAADGETVGESDSPLVVTADMVGKKIAAIVSVQREGYYPITRRTDFSAKVVKGTLGTTPTPTVAGSRVVGETLTATVGTWSTGTELTYSWKRDGVAIAGQTSTTYELAADDRGTKITFSVKGTKPGYNSVTKTSASPSATLGVFDAPQPETSVPNSTVGSTFTVTMGTWTPKASSYTYQWYRNDVAIKGATAKTYTTVAADADKSITVTITGKKTGYKTLSVTSAPFYFGTLG